MNEPANVNGKGAPIVAGLDRPRCYGCEHWFRNERNQPGWGNCSLNPPTLFVRGYEIKAIDAPVPRNVMVAVDFGSFFALTFQETKCGQFKRRETVSLPDALAAFQPQHGADAVEVPVHDNAREGERA
jgi:hypothetical protein